MSKVIDENKIPVYDRAAYDALPEQQKAEYFGFGRGTRGDFDVPEFNAIKEEKVLQKGNSYVVLGLDRPGRETSGYGGQKAMQCASIDIVAGRAGYKAIRRNSKGKLNKVENNFVLDAARIYVSQKSNVDGNFRLAQGRVGNTTFNSPRSTVALKADTLRLIARENIKLVTRTDKENSQGGKLDNKLTNIYGIDLIAMNDDSELQPMVKGGNLIECLTAIMSAMRDTVGVFNSFLEYDRNAKTALMNHTHYSPFNGVPTSPALDVSPSLSDSLMNTLANVSTELQKHQQRLQSVERTYLKAPAGAETVEKDGERERSLFILSKYNSNN